MSDAGDDHKGPSDAGSITPKKDVTRRSSKRNSKSRRSVSSTSTPMKALLEHERQTATDKFGKFFSNQAISDRVSGTLVYKVVATVKINGITYAINTGSTNYQAVKEKFIHSSTNPFKFHKLSFAAVREIQDVVVAHIRKTIRADQEYSLFDTFKDELRRDVVIRLRTHKEYATRPGNSHRRDGMYLENDITENFLSQLEPVYMLPLLLIATLPLIETAGKGSHESTIMAILRYESKRLMLLHSGYFTDRMALFQNYTKVHEGIRAMTAEIVKFTKITEWWMGKWYPVKSYNTNITSLGRGLR